MSMRDMKILFFIFFTVEITGKNLLCGLYQDTWYTSIASVYSSIRIYFYCRWLSVDEVEKLNSNKRIEDIRRFEWLAYADDRN